MTFGSKCLFLSSFDGSKSMTFGSFGESKFMTFASKCLFLSTCSLGWSKSMTILNLQLQPDTTHSATGYNQIQLQQDTIATGYIATGYSCHRSGFFCNRIQATRYNTQIYLQPDTSNQIHRSGFFSVNFATGYRQDTVATGYK